MKISSHYKKNLKALVILLVFCSESTALFSNAIALNEGITIESIHPVIIEFDELFYNFLCKPDDNISLSFYLDKLAELVINNKELFKSLIKKLPASLNDHAINNADDVVKEFLATLAEIKEIAHTRSMLRSVKIGKKFKPFIEYLPEKSAQLYNGFGLIKLKLAIDRRLQVP